MTLHTGAVTSVEEWTCPACGRRLLVKWRPFQRMVLEHGDGTVVHTGSKGPVRMTAQVTPS